MPQQGIDISAGLVAQSNGPDLSAGLVTHDDAGVAINEIGNPVIVPKDGESFADTMKRAVTYGQQLVTPEQVNAEMKTAPGKVATTLAAAPAIGAAIPAAEALFGPTVQRVPGGRDALGRMLPWVEQAGPSLARQGFEAALSFAKAHPYISTVLGLGALNRVTGENVVHVVLKQLGFGSE